MESSSKRREFLNLLLPLYLPAFLFSFSYSLLVPVLPMYAEGFNIPFSLVGLLMAGDSVGMLLGDLPAGMLMRRLGQKNSMIIGLILAGGSTSLLFWAPTIAWAVAFRMIAGLGSSFFSVSRHFYLTEMTPMDNRGRILSTFGGIFRFGRLLGPLAGGTVAALFGLRASFLSFGLVCFIALLVVIFYLPHIEVLGQSTPGGAKPKGSLFAYTLKTQFRTLSTAGLGYLFMQMVRSGPVTMIPLYGTFVLNLDVQTLGLITGLSSGLDMLLFYPAGMLMDRWGRKYAMISSCVFLSAGLAMIPFMQSGLSLLLAGIISGLGNGLGSGVMMTLGADLSPQVGRSEFLGAWTLVGDIGSASGPLVTGKLADLMPLPLTAWVIAAGGLVAILIFWFFVPETLKKNQPVQSAGKSPAS